MKTMFNYLFILVLALSLLSCGNKKTDGIKAGSICTIEDGGGKYGIVKVLVINAGEAHVKIYKNKYDQRPAQIDLKTLSLGSIDDPDGFGILHVPLERQGFDNWKPVEVAFEEVTPEDLEGYNYWKNQ